MMLTNMQSNVMKRERSLERLKSLENGRKYWKCYTGVSHQNFLCFAKLEIRTMSSCSPLKKSDFIIRSLSFKVISCHITHFIFLSQEIFWVAKLCIVKCSLEKWRHWRNGKVGRLNHAAKQCCLWKKMACRGPRDVSTANCSEIRDQLRPWGTSWM